MEGGGGEERGGRRGKGKVAYVFGGFDAFAELGGVFFILHKHSRTLGLLHVLREKKRSDDLTHLRL